MSTLFKTFCIVLITSNVAIATRFAFSGPHFNDQRYPSSSGVVGSVISKTEVKLQQPWTLKTPNVEAVSVEITLAPKDEGIPPHHHNGPAVGFIIEGELLFQAHGNPIKILKKGEAFIENDGQVHVWAANASNSTVCKLLATVIGRPGEPLVTFEENYPRDSYEVALAKAQRN